MPFRRINTREFDEPVLVCAKNGVVDLGPGSQDYAKNMIQTTGSRGGGQGSMFAGP